LNILQIDVSINKSLIESSIRHSALRCPFIIVGLTPIHLEADKAPDAALYSPAFAMRLMGMTDRMLKASSYENLTIEINKNNKCNLCGLYFCPNFRKPVECESDPCRSLCPLQADSIHSVDRILKKSIPRGSRPPRTRFVLILGAES
jgi:hypothetical protein